MSKKEILLISLGWSIPCGLVAMLYVVFPPPFGNLMWCMWAGYCTTNLYGASLQNAPKIVLTWGVGVVWALIYNYFFIFLLNIGVGPLMAMFLDVFVVTLLLMIVHMGPLSKTFLSRIAMLFPPVFTLFSSGGDMAVYPYMILSLVIGTGTAVLSQPFTNLIMGLFIKKENESLAK